MAAEFPSALTDEQRGTMRGALRAAFGSARVDSIVLVSGGASGAFPFRVEVDGRRYLVRLEGPASPLRNPHQYRSMRIASAAGIAPAVHYIDEVNRIAVTDFVEERPRGSFPGGPRELCYAVGEMLGRVRDAPPFPCFVDYPEMVDRLWQWVCQTGVLASDVSAPCTERLVQLRQTCAWDSPSFASSHNDAVPRNVLFDGQRLWLVDWESAYRNDPLVDLAIALDSFAPRPELEKVLLEGWLGQRDDAVSSERLAQVRAFTRLYYAGVLLSASAASSGALADREPSAPTIASFRRSIRAGHVMPGSSEAKHLLGRIYMSSFMTGEVPPGLEAAV